MNFEKRAPEGGYQHLFVVMVVVVLFHDRPRPVGRLVFADLGGAWCLSFEDERAVKFEVVLKNFMIPRVSSIWCS